MQDKAPLSKAASCDEEILTFKSCCPLSLRGGGPSLPNLGIKLPNILRKKKQVEKEVEKSEVRVVR